MKGVEGRNAVLLVVFVVLLLFVIAFGFGMVQTASVKGGLYEKMNNPLVWGAEKFTKEGAKKTIKTCESFANEVESLFVHGEVEFECSRWYSNCVKDLEEPPQNPWTNLELSEKDIELVNYLNPTCRTSGIEKLRKMWANKNSYFAGKNEFEQYTLIKNACGSILVKRIFGE